MSLEEQLSGKNISKIEFKRQLELFEKGVPKIDLIKPATSNNGIYIIDNENELIEFFNNSNKSKIKFVPASGAASRMFKFLFEAKKENYKSSEINFLTFKEQYYKFPFAEQFQFKSLIESINQILAKNSLSSLPKALIPFHKYLNKNRLAIEEQIIEGREYCDNNFHFTISKEHIDMIQQKLNESDCINEEIQIDYSFQKSSTDTIAVDMNIKPVEINGEYLFRPGGHGALIENLNEIEKEIIFIKNIDNIQREEHHSESIYFKKLLAGLAIKIKNEIDNLLRSDNFSNESFLNDANTLVNNYFKKGIKFQNIKEALSFLNRPLRICGMVKNEGEPGGGPFWVIDSKFGESLQIIEKSQIDLNDSNQTEILNNSTHFNPVDLVCMPYNYKGEKFDLTKFVNPETSFIAEKSLHGKKIKALELPGLWNGAMAGWLTVFVEVPLSTFNPVKTVNDLLKNGHLEQVES